MPQITNICGPAPDSLAKPAPSKSVFQKIETAIDVGMLQMFVAERPSRVSLEGRTQGGFDPPCFIAVADGNQAIVSVEDDPISWRNIGQDPSVQDVRNEQRSW